MIRLEAAEIDLYTRYFEAMAQHIERAFLFQLPNRFLDEHLFRVLRVALTELFPTIWPSLLEVTDQVFRIQSLHLVVVRRLAYQPALVAQGRNDVVLECSLSAVSHDYSLYPSNLSARRSLLDP